MRPTMPPRTAPRKAFVERRDDHSTSACAVSVLATASAAPKAAAHRVGTSARRSATAHATAKVATAMPRTRIEYRTRLNAWGPLVACLVPLRP